MSQRKHDVAIIGGGVIGAACALELSRRGVTVALVDRGAIGHGCSYGNAGWLTPCFAWPLPSPGMMATALEWMLDPGSPFYVKPRPTPALVRWLWGFSRATAAERFERAVQALVPLSRYSLEVFEKLSGEIPDDFGFVKRGLLMVALTEEGLVHARQDMERMIRHGVPGHFLDAEGVRSLEPAVTKVTRGGVFFPNEAHCEPLAVVKAMAAEAERGGAELLPGTEVFEFALGRSRIEGLRTTRGWVRADRYVLASGAWSGRMALELGLRLPVLGGKGYAVTVRPFDPQPSLPIKILEKRIAITPRRDTVRLAGTLELVDGDETISPRRVDAILRGSRALMNVPEEPEIVEVWRGLRPCTPDGLPAIGFADTITNLFIATGHQMLGLHCAPGTGRLSADLLTGATPSFDPVPFRPGRFS